MFPSSEEIFNKTKAAQSNWKSMGSDSVRMEGLPWSTTEADITEVSQVFYRVIELCQNS